ncbi:MAG TPA: antibiotic biosynthesis monooxygenase [Actinomycetota bacterium]
MIARIWTGQTRAEDAEAYAGYLARTGFPDYRGTPGNRGVLGLRRIDGDRATFTLITLWDSIDAIRAFAGEDPERARYYDEDDRFLLSFPERATHYEVIEGPQTAR